MYGGHVVLVRSAVVHEGLYLDHVVVMLVTVLYGWSCLIYRSLPDREKALSIET